MAHFLTKASAVIVNSVFGVTLPTKIILPPKIKTKTFENSDIRHPFVK